MTRPEIADLLENAGERVCVRLYRRPDGTIILPEGAGPAPEGELSPLMAELLEDGFETLVMNWPEWPAQLLRVSAHHYNDLDEYRALAGVLSAKSGR